MLTARLAVLWSSFQILTLMWCSHSWELLNQPGGLWVRFSLSPGKGEQFRIVFGNNLAREIMESSSVEVRMSHLAMVLGTLLWLALCGHGQPPANLSQAGTQERQLYTGWSWDSSIWAQRCVCARDPITARDQFSVIRLKNKINNASKTNCNRCVTQGTSSKEIDGCSYEACEMSVSWFKKSKRVLRETLFIMNLYDLTVTHSKIELINHSQHWLE